MDISLSRKRILDLVAGCLMVVLGGTAWAQAEHCVAPGVWLDPTSEQRPSHAEILSRAASQQVVLLGEHHDNRDHHRWQLQVMAGLYARRPDMVLGFEMFPRDKQPVLDRWVAGELTEQAFLTATDWENTWHFDADLYLPLFHFARINRIPMLALNVNRSLLAQVRDEGWAGVPASRRDGITDPAPAQREYLELLAASFISHRTPDHSASRDMRPEEKRAFQRFVEGQQLWDRAMAHSIAAALSADQPPLLVAMIGTGHMLRGFGVPHQLADLGVKKVHWLVPWDDQLDCGDMRPGYAHGVFGLAPSLESEQEPMRPKLGVYLEVDDAGAVQVAKISPHSIAEALGIEAGDRIVEIAGLKVAQVVDVIHAVQRMSPGTWLPFVVQRGERRLEMVAKFPPALP